MHGRFSFPVRPVVQLVAGSRRLWGVIVRLVSRVELLQDARGMECQLPAVRGTRRFIDRGVRLSR
jgi:hypothetical protein